MSDSLNQLSVDIQSNAIQIYSNIFTEPRHALMPSIIWRKSPKHTFKLSLKDKETNIRKNRKFLFLCSTRPLRSLVSYRVEESRRNSTSTRAYITLYLYSQSNMKSIGNIATKIHVSPKLNLNYMCRRRFRLSLNQQLHMM